MSSEPSKKNQVATLKPRQLEAYKNTSWVLMPGRPFTAKDAEGKSVAKLPRKGWPTLTCNTNATIKTCIQRGFNPLVRLGPTDVVIEYDPRRDPADPFGAEPTQWDRYLAENGIDAKEHPTGLSGSGGYHQYMRVPQGVKVRDNLRKKYPAIEVKTAGRYVVAMGGVHPNGENYTWLEGTPPLSEAKMMPPKLVKELTAALRSAHKAVGGGNSTPEQIAAALDGLDVENFASDAAWFPIMCACHHASGGAALDEFTAWSLSDPAYADDEDKIKSRWESLDASKENAITVGTLNAELVKLGLANKTLDTGNAADDFPDDPDPDWLKPADPLDDGLEKPKRKFSFTPYVWRPSSEIPRREWHYKPLYIPKYLSLTVAPGGLGKSSLIRTECVAMASGKAILGIEPVRRLRVEYWNGEDPVDELERSFAAIMKHYGLEADDVQDYLHFDSGRELPINLASMRRGEFKIAVPEYDALAAAMLDRKIDVLVIDPFISCHTVTENDNVMLDHVAKELASKIADATNSSVHLSHHVRKTNGEEATIEASRGASSLKDAARVRRVLNSMPSAVAKNVGVKANERFKYFYADYGQSSLIPAGQSHHWFTFDSVELDNVGSDPEKQPGDDMGVPVQYALTTWVPRAGDIETALDLIGEGGPWRKQANAKDKWVGNPIATACQLDPVNDRKKINDTITQWLAEGILREETGEDEHRHKCKVIVAGKPPNPADDFDDFDGSGD